MGILVVAGGTLAISLYFLFASLFLKQQHSPAGSSLGLMAVTNLAAGLWLLPVWVGMWMAEQVVVPTSPAFWLNLLLVVGLTAAARHFHFLALSRRSLGEIAPFAGVTPPASILVAMLVLGEYPSAAGVGLILVVALSIYFIHLKETEARLPTRLLQPVRALFRDRYIMFGLLSALPPALGIALVKKSVGESDALTYAVGFCFLMGVGALLLGATQARAVSALSWGNPSLSIVLGGGFLMAIASYLNSLATQLYLVPNLTAMSRSSIAIQVVLGWLFLKERDGFGRKLMGSLVILVAFVLLGLEPAQSTP